MDENKIGGNMSVSQASNVMKEFSMVGKRQAVKDQFAGLSGFGAGLQDVAGGLSLMTGLHGMATGVQNFMMTPDKKTKKKNILTAVAILAFMVFLFVFTLYNVGVFDRQI